MRIFISFASIDRDLAREVGARLRTDGHRVFVDASSLEPGSPYDAEIRREIGRSDLFVVLVSPESVAERSYARTELGLFEERWPRPGKRILLAEVRATPDAALPPYLRGLHVLRRTGNLIAELVAHVDRRTRMRRRRRLWAAAAAIALCSGGAAAITAWRSPASANVDNPVGTHDAGTIDAGLLEPVALDATIASRARVVAVSRGMMWLGLAAPDQLVRLDDHGLVVDAAPLPGAPTAIGPAPRPDDLMVAVTTPSGPTLMRWDTVARRANDTTPIVIPDTASAQFARTAYTIGVDEDHQLWIATADGRGEPALATLERNGTWKAHLQDVSSDIESVTFTNYRAMLLVLTSGSPGYIYRLTSKGVWQVSGHKVDWVGCLDAMTTSGEPWLGVSCDRDIVEIQAGTWPPMTRNQPTAADSTLTATPRVHDLGRTYPSTSWRAVALVQEAGLVLVAMEHLDRSQVPYKFLESAIAASDGTSAWTELLRLPEHVRSLALHDGLAVVVTSGGAHAYRTRRRDRSAP